MAHAPALATFETDAWWNSIVQTIWQRASHDVKDALNGVSVNIEVIRSRATRADLPAAALAPFGEAAGTQAEKLATLLDALLGLARAEREPPDVALIVRRLAVAVSASSSPSDRKIVVDTSGVAGPTTVQVKGEVVRIALAGLLLGAVTSYSSLGGGPFDCGIFTDGDVVRVRLSNIGTATRPAPQEEFFQQHGIAIVRDGDTINMNFPRL